jgi:hypothetical protein
LPAQRTFECEINKSNLDVQWFRNGQPLTPGKKFKMEAVGNVYRLTINDITAEDDADYTVKVVDKNVESTAALFVKGKT